MVKLAGLFVPMIREVGDVMYQWTGPFVSDASKFQREFDPSSHAARRGRPPDGRLYLERERARPR